MIKNPILSESQYRISIECAGCQKAVTKYKSQLKAGTYAFCSLSCRNKNYQKVEPNWKPNNYIGPISKLCKGCKNTFKVSRRDNGSNRKYCSQTCAAKHITRKPHTTQTKAKLSKAASLQNKRRLSKHIYKSGDEIIYMRSGWEVKYAQYLSENNVGWEYESKIFKLSNGYMYTPDFKLDSGVIIEIKGYWRDDAKEKWDLFCKDYPDIEKKVLMKADLQGLGVLN